MTKQELEKAIENGEDVWVATDSDIEQLSELKWHNNYIGSYNKNKYCFHIITEDYFNHLYKTKAEAEHYLHHANITRIETLPFLIWEEFSEGKEIKFNSKKSEYLMIYLAGNITIYQYYYDNGLKLQLRIFDEEATEANFYKAYDECVRLFKG